MTKFKAVVASCLLLSILFSLPTHAYKIFINDTGRHINQDIAAQYAWLSLKEFDFVNNKNDLKKYDKNQYVMIVKNKKHVPREAHIFVFFPLKGDSGYDLKKSKDYGYAVLDLVKEGYIFPNLSGNGPVSIEEQVNMIVEEGLGPDIPIE